MMTYKDSKKGFRERNLLKHPTNPLILIIIICLIAGCKRAEIKKETEEDKDVEAYLELLDKDILHSEDYVALKTDFIDSLKAECHEKENTGEKIKLYIELSRHYRQFDSDSAIHYALLANNEIKELPTERALQHESRLALVDALSTSGIFNESLRLLSEVDADTLTMPEKIEYWKSARMLYSYAMAYLQENNVFTDNYRKRYTEADDSLLAHLDHSDSYYKFLSAERLVIQRKWDKAKQLLSWLMADNPLESNIYGMSAYQLAEMYKNTGEFDNYQKALALSSRSDIRGAVREGIALPTLANVLYKEGEPEKAFKYINKALEEANNANIRMRTVSITSNMAMIDRAYKNELESSRRRWIVFLVIASCLLLVAMILSAVLVMNVRKARKDQRNLKLLSATLRAYVGNFISLCANYANRLEQASKTVVRKINAGQTDDLLKIMNSGKFGEEDNEEFYRLVDKAILDIFPDYISNINNLLLPDKKIIEEDTQNALTPELRIYAIVRLGVDQSAEIARILHYSVNTVYAYRNRMRNRAINRETFDSDVAALGIGMD